VAWTHKGDEETSLLVIASHSTPLPYLAVLRQERIPYLIAGARQVDLSPRWRRSGRGSAPGAWYRRPEAGSTAPSCEPAWSMNSTSSRSPR
jgi:hypothetical protein